MSTPIRIDEITGNDRLIVEHSWDGKTQVRAVKLQDLVDAIIAMLPTTLVRQYHLSIQSTLTLRHGLGQVRALQVQHPLRLRHSVGLVRLLHLQHQLRLQQQVTTKGGKSK